MYLLQAICFSQFQRAKILSTWEWSHTPRTQEKGNIGSCQPLLAGTSSTHLCGSWRRKHNSKSYSSGRSWPTQVPEEVVPKASSFKRPGPQLTNLRPQLIKSWPQLCNLRPQLSNLRPQLSKLRPQYTKLWPQLNKLWPQLTNLRPQLSKLWPQLS